MKMATLAGLLLSGCATVYEYPLYDRHDPDFIDKPITTAERRTEFFKSPGRLSVRVMERRYSQMIRMRRKTSVERLRRATVSLDPMTHVAIWTIGWAIGGPIVWYPVLHPKAQIKAREAAYTGSRDPGYPPIWSVEIQEIDRKTEEPETVLRPLGPPQATGDVPVPGIDVDVRALQEVLPVRTDASGTAEVPLKPFVLRHLNQNGLVPLEVTAGEARATLEPPDLVSFFSQADWSRAQGAPEGEASADVDLDQQALEITLVNNGEGDLTQLWIRVSGQEPIFVGRVKPHELVTRRIPVDGPEVTVEFFEERGCVPQPAMRRLAPK